MFRCNDWGSHDHRDGSCFQQEHEDCQRDRYADLQMSAGPGIQLVPERINAMSLARVAVGILVTICVIGVTAIGQQEQTPPQPAPKTQLELCMDAMPAIFKNYNNAKYAVFRMVNSESAAQAREALAELDAMEQPLKGCYEASQSRGPEQQPR